MSHLTACVFIDLLLCGLLIIDDLSEDRVEFMVDLKFNSQNLIIKINGNLRFEIKITVI
jgi:hypothetical protein